MNNFLEGGFLKGQKTYVLAATGVITAIGLWLVGDTSLVDVLQLGIGSFMGATIRAGVANSGE